MVETPPAKTGDTLVMIVGEGELETEHPFQMNFNQKRAVCDEGSSVSCSEN